MTGKPDTPSRAIQADAIATVMLGQYLMLFLMQKNYERHR
jgi:hypothetical protein